MTKFHFSAILLLVFATNCLLSQSPIKKEHKKPNNWSIHIKYGIPFFEHEEPTYNSFDTEIHHYPLYHTTVGLGYQHYILKNLSVKAGLSYELGSFSKVEKINWTNFRGEVMRSEITDEYQTHSVLSPIQAFYHMKRLSVSIGFVPIVHLATQVGVRKQFWNDDDRVEVYDKIIFKDGDNYFSNPGPLSDHVSTNLDRKVNFQIAMGFQYRITPKFLLDFEVRQNLIENQLVKAHDQYDVGGDPVLENFNPYPRILTLGLLYDLSRKN